MSDYIWPNTAPGVLTKITEEQADYMLDVLPPVYGPSFFGMGEPHSHTAEGRPTFHWVQKRGADYFITLGTKADAESAFAVR